MNKEEIENKCQSIMETAKLEIKRIKNTWAIDNCKYDIGDIIEDHYHIIKVEDIRAWRFPEVVYSGIQLTKKLVPSKRQSDTKIYSTNIKRVII